MGQWSLHSALYAIEKNLSYRFLEINTNTTLKLESNKTKNFTD
jgi:hypothetical protein